MTGLCNNIQNLVDQVQIFVDNENDVGLFHMNVALKSLRLSCVVVDIYESVKMIYIHLKILHQCVGIEVGLVFN